MVAETPLTVMLVAAEASGDILGAELATALRLRLGDGVRFVGVGGRRMAAEGVTSPSSRACAPIRESSAEYARQWP